MNSFVILTILVSVAFANTAPDGRIVGGKDGDISDFPYQLSMRVNGRHGCGASIIAKRWILTAAHCLEKVPTFQISFRAGSSLYTKGGIVVEAEQTFIHPGYNRYSDYDVGLVKTKTDIVGPNIAPIALPAAGDDVPIGKSGTVSGWGFLKEDGQILPEHLKYVNLPIIDQQTCNTRLAPHGGIRGMMFCAGSPGHDACRGDSGGPMVYNNVQIGVVSYGITCDDPKFPGVYTRTGNANVRAWIHNTAKV